MRRNPLESMTVAATLLLLLSGCGLTDVSNPGPIQDVALEDPAAGRTVFIGLVSDIEVATGSAAYYAGVASTDLNADATQGWVQNFGAGRLLTEESSYVWDEAQAARWSAEYGIERLKKTQADPAKSPWIAGSYLWAGYANRILGDIACVAVFDGGPAEPNAKYYERALAHFQEATTRATAIGTTMDSLRLGDHRRSEEEAEQRRGNA